MVDANLAGRLCIMAIGLLIFGYMVFKHTPDLNEVENRFFYRLCILVVMVRGFMFLMIDMIGLFPVPK